MVQNETGDRDIEHAVAKRKRSDVGDYSGTGAAHTSIAAQHVVFEIARRDECARRGEHCADGAGACAGVEHGAVVRGESAAPDEVLRQGSIGERRVFGPAVAGTGVGMAGGVDTEQHGIAQRRVAQPSHDAPSKAAASHHASSAGSPTAFSHAKTATMPSIDRPSWRSHHPVVSTP